MSLQAKIKAMYVRERTTRRHTENRAWAIDFLGGCCKSCGTQEDLEFDHVDPSTKSFNLGSHLGRYSLKKLKAELVKCQLLCTACHKVKTGVAECGTRSGYVKGCRCADCTEANRVYYRRYWDSKRGVSSTG